MKSFAEILSFLIVIFAGNVLAKSVSAPEAGKVAVTFLNYKSAKPVFRIDAATHFKHTFDGHDIFHVFNFEERGFVITSADDRFFPILVWSLDSHFPDDNLPENVKSWIAWYEKQIASALEDPHYHAMHHQKEWEILTAGSMIKSIAGRDQGVEALLTSIWDQGKYYNDMCPEDPSGTGNHVSVGCVATAMSQIMYYFRYPEQGTGYNEYIPPYNQGFFGLLWADFGNTIYRWDEMTDVCLTDNPAVAELCYHCGVSVNMSYSPTGSAAGAQEAAEALVEYFRYSPEIQGHSRSDYGTFEDWQTLLISHLENGIPILYRSNAGWGGHAYVCDGYQDSTHFHFNWGWSGNYDGYYFIDELIPGGINLSYAQGGIFNIYPDTVLYTYPAYCQGSQVLSGTTGSLEDGSGPETYRPSAYCSWLISPEDTSVTNILLQFSRFKTESNTDFLSVYNGSSVNDPMVATFSGENIPSDLHVPGDKVLITFETNENIQSDGWLINYAGYTLPFCQQGQVADEPTGTIDDGSGFLNYTNDQQCSWLLDPAPQPEDSVAKFRLEFEKFQTQPGDTLFIYDGTDASCELLGMFSGNTLPGDCLSSGARVFLEFLTDGTETGDGWTLNYIPVSPRYCNDTVLITAASGVIEDGSGEKRYAENADCHWKIDIPGAEQITIDFIEVDTEPNYDYVKIRGDSTAVIATVTGNQIPGPIEVDGSVAWIWFHSDSRDNFQGWKLQYHGSSQGIGGMTKPVVQIHPNPAEDFLVVETSMVTEHPVKYQIAKTDGRIFKTGSFDQNQSLIDLTQIPRGMYLLRIFQKNRTYVKKIIKH